MKERGIKGSTPWMITFEKLLSKTEFASTMQKMLKAIEKKYEYPVDIEFTANFSPDETIKINLLQCRPLQTKGTAIKVDLPDDIQKEKTLFSSVGHTMGGSISTPIKRIIFVEPEGYQKAILDQKYDVARLIGKLNRLIDDRDVLPTILLGPGRWGTTTPSLGVPVSFSEINKIAVLSEIAYEGGNLMPELSFGTHFFQDLVETDIFYVAIFPGKENVFFNCDMLYDMPNILTELVPEAGKYENIVRVCEPQGQPLKVMCDMMSKRIACFFS